MNMRIRSDEKDEPIASAERGDARGSRFPRDLQEASHSIRPCNRKSTPVQALLIGDSDLEDVAEQLRSMNVATYW